MDTKQSLLFVAERFEAIVQSVTGFDLKQAQLIGIELSAGGDNSPTIVSQPLDASGDVYELLDTKFFSCGNCFCKKIMHHR